MRSLKERKAALREAAEKLQADQAAIAMEEAGHVATFIFVAFDRDVLRRALGAAPVDGRTATGEVAALQPLSLRDAANRVGPTILRFYPEVKLDVVTRTHRQERRKYLLWRATGDAQSLLRTLRQQLDVDMSPFPERVA